MDENCERAKDLAEYLSDGDPRVDRIVKACCGKEDGRECLELLTEMAADAACRAYTNNACPACCEYVAGIVAEKFVALLYETGIGGVFEDYWDLGRSIVASFLGGECDFDPKRNEALAKSMSVGRSTAEALAEAWAAVHVRNDIAIPQWAMGGYYVPITSHFDGDVWSLSTYANRKATPRTWEELLVNTAANLKINPSDPSSKRYKDFLAVSDSSWGAMYFEPVIKGQYAFETYLRVRFQHWKCDRADQFNSSLAQALNLRLEGLNAARVVLTRRIGKFYVQNAPTMTRRAGIAPMKKSSPPIGAIVGGATTAIGASIVGFSAWKLL